MSQQTTSAETKKRNENPNRIHPLAALLNDVTMKQNEIKMANEEIAKCQQEYDEKAKRLAQLNADNKQLLAQVQNKNQLNAHAIAALKQLDNACNGLEQTLPATEKTVCDVLREMNAETLNLSNALATLNGDNEKLQKQIENDAMLHKIELEGKQMLIDKNTNEIELVNQSVLELQVTKGDKTKQKDLLSTERKMQQVDYNASLETQQRLKEQLNVATVEYQKLEHDVFEKTNQLNALMSATNNKTLMVQAQIENTNQAIKNINDDIASLENQNYANCLSILNNTKATMSSKVEVNERDSLKSEVARKSKELEVIQTANTMENISSDVVTTAKSKLESLLFEINRVETNAEIDNYKKSCQYEEKMLSAKGEALQRNVDEAKQKQVTVDAERKVEMEAHMKEFDVAQQKYETSKMQYKKLKAECNVLNRRINYLRATASRSTNETKPVQNDSVVHNASAQCEDISSSQSTVDGIPFCQSKFYQAK